MRPPRPPRLLQAPGRFTGSPPGGAGSEGRLPSALQADCLTQLLAGQAGPTRAPGGPRALVPTATRATRSPRALSALPPPAPARPSLADVTLPPRLCPVGSLERGRTR